MTSHQSLSQVFTTNMHHTASKFWYKAHYLKINANYHFNSFPELIYTYSYFSTFTTKYQNINHSQHFIHCRNPDYSTKTHHWHEIVTLKYLCDSLQCNMSWELRWSVIRFSYIPWFVLDPTDHLLLCKNCWNNSCLDVSTEAKSSTLQASRQQCTNTAST